MRKQYRASVKKSNRTTDTLRYEVQKINRALRKDGTFLVADSNSSKGIKAWSHIGRIWLTQNAWSSDPVELTTEKREKAVAIVKSLGFQVIETSNKFEYEIKVA